MSLVCRIDTVVSNLAGGTKVFVVASDADVGCLNVGVERTPGCLHFWPPWGWQQRETRPPKWATFPGHVMRRAAQ
jgi:hypothetical protein